MDKVEVGPTLELPLFQIVDGPEKAPFEPFVAVGPRPRRGLR